MKACIFRVAAAFGFVAALALAGPASAQSSAAASPRAMLPPLSLAMVTYFKQHPDDFARFNARQRRPVDVVVATRNRALPPGSGKWQAIAAGPDGMCNPLLLTDGSVIVHNCDTPDWYKLTPDHHGNYAAGTWSTLASMPVIGGTQYAPQYNASAVLPDGRVIVMGGEYNGSGNGVLTNLGAIYSSVADTWTPVAAPTGSSWSEIGDAQSVVLSKGTFMLASCCADPAADALLDARDLTWTTTGAPTHGDNYQDEQGYDLLPDNTLLTVDVWTNYPKYTATNTEIYKPGSGVWSAGANTPVPLADPCGTSEIGPQVLRGDGTVVAFGGYSGCKNGTIDPTAVYSTATKKWQAGPNVLSVCGSDGTTACSLADAPAALMPNGKILFAASSGFGDVPTHFFEFGPKNTIVQVADPLFNADSSGAYYYNLLVLPNGQVLMTDFSNTAEVYTPQGAALASYAPAITTIPSVVTRGQSYQVAGTQLNGVSQGAYYGDDAQAATNYPLVKITNAATGRVAFARTSGFSTMSIAPGTAGSAIFKVPNSAQTGASTVVVIANGVASQPVDITVQ